jgi:hypothetical protein
MPTLDTARFVFTLAGACNAGDWTDAGLKTAISRAACEMRILIPGLGTRILKQFPQAPGYRLLLAFLVADGGLTRALSRFNTLASSRRVLPRRGTLAMGTPPPNLGELAIPSLANESALAEWLEVTPCRLRWYADITGRNRKHPNGPLRNYRARWIAKPNGRSRLLEIPKAKLKRIQRKILADILNHVPPHAAAHGFRPGCSAISNAAAHCGCAVVIKFDLVDFFPSVPAARVFRIFRTIGYPETVARLLTGLCTTRQPLDIWDKRPNPAPDGSDYTTRLRFAERHLPQGAPTSPALANLAACRLDRRLRRLAASLDATYTRYADDLTFSGSAELARGTTRLMRLVAIIAAEEGFSMNSRKTRVMRHGNRQTVTGVVVNAKPNVLRADFDRLKAILTNCVRHGAVSQNRDKHLNFRAHLEGRIAHFAAINPTRGRKLWALFDRIAWGENPASANS